MEWFFVFIGAIWTIDGFLFFVTPDSVRRMLRQFLSDINLRALGVIPFITGILLLILAPAGRCVLFIRILGGLSVLKGIAVFAMPNRITRYWIERFINAPKYLYLLWGAVMTALGPFVAYMKR